MLADPESLASLVRCPRCRGPLDGTRRPVCTNAECDLAGAGFSPSPSGPVLIDFENSILDRSTFEQRDGASVVPRRDERWRQLYRKLGGRANPVVGRNESRFLEHLSGERPRVLMVGGGSWTGLRRLPFDPTIELVSLDVYVGDSVNLVADAHRIPLPDGGVCAVWIQAVLEHVLDPRAVVAEIHRVLRPHGLVYAETPFLQAVHEGAYDFTRYTHSGHRWLFRGFEELDSGMIFGPGTSVAWAMESFVGALFRSDAAGRAVQFLAAPWRWMDRWCDPQRALDGANAFYFLGRKSETALCPGSMTTYYRGANTR